MAARRDDLRNADNLAQLAAQVEVKKRSAVDAVADGEPGRAQKLSSEAAELETSIANRKKEADALEKELQAFPKKRAEISNQNL